MANGSALRGPTLWILILIGAIVAVIFLAYHYLQDLSEADLRDTLLAETHQRQMETTRSMTRHITSDIDSIILRLQLLAAHPEFQRGDLDGDNATAILKETYAKVSELTIIDGMPIIDKDNIAVNNAVDEYRQATVGADRSEREYVKAVSDTMKPYVSGVFETSYGKWAIGVAVPILVHESGEYRGLIVANLPTIEFFERYGNVHDFDSRTIVALDRNGYVISSFLSETIGKYDFSPEVQELLGPSEERDVVYRSVLSGEPSSAVFTASLGEILITGYPVIVDGEQVMSVILSIPTDAIYDRVDERMATTRLQVSLMLVAICLAIIGLIVFVVRWNRSLDTRVREKTTELQHANEQLLLHDNLQKEFINIAAHELRTPVQPILGIVEGLGVYPPKEEDDNEEEVRVKKGDLRMMARNAARLVRLSSDILDVSRIESGQLGITPEKFELNELVKEAIDSAKKQLDLGNIEITFLSCAKPIHLVADRVRIMQVVSNLLSNAIRFTSPGGMVTVITEVQQDSAKVIVKDSGTGIADDIVPRLFTRFGSSIRSNSGTGLGLYICKSIVEAHGGKIWGENDSDGGGALFTFTLPIAAPIGE
jgi:signal transduction histidine kinase